MRNSPILLWHCLIILFAGAWVEAAPAAPPSEEDGSKDLERAWEEAMEATPPGGRADLVGKFRPRFLFLAGEGNLDAYLWLLEEGAVEDGGARLGLYQVLVREHAREDGPGLGRLLRLLEHDPGLTLGEAGGLVRVLIDGSGDGEARGRALLALALRTSPVSCEDLARQQASARLCREIIERWPGTRAASRAAGHAWRLEHLAVGRKAPGFTARDARGNELCSQHLLGRVVVVDVWSFDAPGTRDSIMEQESLRGRLWDERFTWLGVNLDSDPDGFVRTCEDLGLDWRQHSWEGGDHRGVCDAWRLGTQRQTLLLDDLGVVRGVDLEPGELQRRISKLLGDLEGRIFERETLLEVGQFGGR